MSSTEPYVFGAWSEDPYWRNYARHLAFAYAGKYGADEGPMPPTDESILAVTAGCSVRVRPEWLPDIHQAIAMLPFADAAMEFGRAVHDLVCPRIHPNRHYCHCTR